MVVHACRRNSVNNVTGDEVPDGEGSGGGSTDGHDIGVGHLDEEVPRSDNYGRGAIGAEGTDADGPGGDIFDADDISAEVLEEGLGGHDIDRDDGGQADLDEEEAGCGIDIADCVAEDVLRCGGPGGIGSERDERAVRDSWRSGRCPRPSEPRRQ